MLIISSKEKKHCTWSFFLKVKSILWRLSIIFQLLLNCKWVYWVNFTNILCFVCYAALHGTSGTKKKWYVIFEKVCDEDASLQQKSSLLFSDHVRKDWKRWYWCSPHNTLIQQNFPAFLQYSALCVCWCDTYKSSGIIRSSSTYSTVVVVIGSVGMMRLIQNAASVLSECSHTVSAQ